MRSLLHHLVVCGQELALHPYFRRRERSAAPEARAALRASLAFWMFSVEDLLGLLEGRILDPALAALAQGPSSRLSARAKTFRDARGAPEASELWAPALVGARRGSYALLSEALRTAQDADVLAVLFSLDRASQLVFEATYEAPRSLLRREPPPPDAELEQLAGLRLSLTEGARLRSIADRVFRAVRAMLDVAEVLADAQAEASRGPRALRVVTAS